jgi:hypothetical protein
MTGWAAQSYGHLAVLEWARANGCPGAEEDEEEEEEEEEEGD